MTPQKEPRKWATSERVGFWIKVSAIVASMAAGLSAGGLSYADMLGLQSSSDAEKKFEQINTKLDDLSHRIDQLFARECPDAK